MGANKVADDNTEIATGVVAADDDDFGSLDQEKYKTEIGGALYGNKTREDHFPAPTKEDLNHLAPGCFVRIGLGDAAYWVEIGKINGVTISGMVHPELSGTLCLIDHDSCEIARFSRDQVTALGCDRYCWC
ncbi:MAG TPA: hypothetical protein DIC36_04040 [Gammaproteobacteria bacterium]|nr:hypothetical protein [Gammaproteobacteria bacterium]